MPKRTPRGADSGPLVLWASRWRSLLTAMGGLVVAVIAATFLYTAIVVHSLGMVEPGLLALVFLLGGLLFLVVGVIAALRRRTVTVDDRGILLALSIDSRPWLIEWSQIREVFVSSGPQFNLPLALAIVPKSRELFGRDRSAGERKVMATDWERYGAAVTIQLDLFTRPEGEIQDLLLAACRSHGVRVREDEGAGKGADGDNA